uniref:Uncharacterized protein n=1 Tax=Ascaris lumbricoides TaxID=6252 RepID=A0A0M3I7C4_ASCLU
MWPMLSAEWKMRGKILNGKIFPENVVPIGAPGKPFGRIRNMWRASFPVIFGNVIARLNRNASLRDSQKRFYSLPLTPTARGRRQGVQGGAGAPLCINPSNDAGFLMNL